jgi:hypothetical protein
MIKDIIIEIEGVHISDFNTELPEPPFTEATEGGISIMFTDIDELKSYHSSLVAQDDAEGDAAPKPLQVKIAAAVMKWYWMRSVRMQNRCFPSSLMRMPTGKTG